MKKLLTFAAVLLLSVVAMAQDPVITFETMDHDFGKINEADGRVTTVFKFVNEGMSPLVLSNVRASCGCTTPQWTKEPIAPGQSGEITVTYNPSGRPGRFQKTITVTSNATDNTKRLTIRGEVIPRNATPAEQYPVKMGVLNLERNNIEFGQLKKGGYKEMVIQYCNKTDKPIKVDIIPAYGLDFLAYHVSLNTIEPGKVGRITIGLDDKNVSNNYGPFQGEIYVVVNGTKNLSKEFAITVSGELVEDFSGLTQEQLMQAPILEAEKTIDFGTIAANKKVKKTITLKNIGTNPLLVRRVLSTDKKHYIITSAPKSLKSGKKGDIKFEIDTNGLKPSQYKREIQVITNDPKNPIHKIMIVFTIQ